MDNGVALIVCFFNFSNGAMVGVHLALCSSPITVLLLDIEWKTTQLNLFPTNFIRCETSWWIKVIVEFAVKIWVVEHHQSQTEIKTRREIMLLKIAVILVNISCYHLQSGFPRVLVVYLQVHICLKPFSQSTLSCTRIFFNLQEVMSCSFYDKAIGGNLLI